MSLLYLCREAVSILKASASPRECRDAGDDPFATTIALWLDVLAVKRSATLPAAKKGMKKKKAVTILVVRRGRAIDDDQSRKKEER